MQVTLKNHRACVVGSRTLTGQDAMRIQVIGNLLHQLNVQGASGNALGNDQEWDKYIFVQHFLPWNNHNGRKNGDNNFQYLSLTDAPKELTDKAAKIAMDHHPAWYRLKRGGRAMHTRNVFQALGIKLTPETYADLTIYCADETPSRKVSGGTATAVEISRSHGIPTFNLRFDSDFEELKAILESLLEN